MKSIFESFKRYSILILIVFISFFYIEYPIVIHNISTLSLFDRIKNLVVILQDDVMITMRVSKFFLDNGYLGFNLTDLSQPSTSYLYPIIISPLFLLPDNLALLIVALIGLFSIILTGHLITKNVYQYKHFYLLILMIFFFNRTTLFYALSGWEILLQTLLITTIWILGLRLKASNKIENYIFIGVLAAVSLLIRLDSSILLFLLALYLIKLNWLRSVIFAGIPFVTIILVSFYFQFSTFNNILPTTARLKASSIIPFEYSLNYYLSLLTSNSAALWILLIILLGIFFSSKKVLSLKLHSLLASLILANIYLFTVSDVFLYGRMFLPLLALAIILLVEFFLSQNESFKVKIDQISKFVILIFLMLNSPLIIRNFANQGIVRISSPDYKSSYSLHKNVDHYLLTEYIRNNIPPIEGSIGVFWLGTSSFYLYDYEMADFLGKADESIAQLEPLNSIPGHNKWNTRISFEKWNPAIIISNEATMADITEHGCNEGFDYDWAFYKEFHCYALSLNYVEYNPLQISEVLLIRRDVYEKYYNN